MSSPGGAGFFAPVKWFVGPTYWVEGLSSDIPIADLSALYEILQAVSVSSFEPILLEQLFMKIDTKKPHLKIPKHLEINY